MSSRGRLHGPSARRPAAAHSHRSSIAVAGGLRCGARRTGKLQPPQGRVEVRAQLRTARLRSRRKRSYDQRATVRQGSESVRDEVTQTPADPVPHHGIAHGLTHDEPCLLPLAGLGERVQHKAAAPGSDAAAHDGTEFLTAPQASVGGKHARSDPAAGEVRRTASDGPCDDGRPRSRGRPAYASAAGIRGSARVDGCSAGRCACSRRHSPGLATYRSVVAPGPRVHHGRRRDSLRTDDLVGRVAVTPRCRRQTFQGYAPGRPSLTPPPAAGLLLTDPVRMATRRRPWNPCSNEPLVAWTSAC